MSKRYQTRQAVTVHLTRTTSINVPAGTELQTVLDGMGRTQYAVKNPHKLIAPENNFGRHDATHYYAWIDAGNVEEIA